MRAIWNGMLSFGLVNIPVGLYPATDDRDLQLHLLHKKDHGRIRNQRICTVDNQPVDYSELVRGYEYEKGKFIELTDEDLDKVKVAGTDNIIIDEFVDEDEIDPKYFDKPYFLLPGKKSDAPYALLRESLKKTGKVGIARIVIRSRERLACIRVDGPVIMLDTMHFADELREVDAPAQTTVGEKEMGLAKMLIDAMTSKFEPERYHDTYREAVMDMIEHKIAGEQTVSPVSHPKATEIVDLMAYLKNSIEQRKASKDDSTEAAKPVRRSASNARSRSTVEKKPTQSKSTRRTHAIA